MSLFPAATPHEAIAMTDDDRRPRIPARRSLRERFLDRLLGASPAGTAAPERSGYPLWRRVVSGLLGRRLPRR